MIQKASRKIAPLKVGFSGPSGSGKTYSAILMASGMVPLSDVCVIDSENRSSHLYSHLGGNDTYSVIELTAPFTPEKYIEAIHECEKAGFKVIIIDSITHEWDGSGGCLQIQSAMGGRYQDWAAVTPRHQRFIDAITQSPCHVFTTVRRKQDYDMSKNEAGKMTVTKVGTKEVMREGFEYEMTLSLEISINHFATQSKDRTELFSKREPFIISANTGKELLAWSQSGAAPAPAPQAVKMPDKSDVAGVVAALPSPTVSQTVAPQATASVPSSITQDDVRAAMLAYSKSHDMKAVIKILKDIAGVEKLADAKPQHYAALMAKLKVA